MTDSSEAEFDKWWDDPQRKDFSFSRYLAALAAWSACAEKAAGEKKDIIYLLDRCDSMLSYIRHRSGITNWDSPGFMLGRADMDDLIVKVKVARNNLDAEIRRRLGGKHESS